MKYIKDSSDIASKKRSLKINLKVNTFSVLSSPYMVVLMLFIVLPMLIIVLYSITKQEGDVFQFTLYNFVEIFNRKEYLLNYIDSIRVALITTAICLIIGYPVAFFISKMKTRQANLFILMITAPMWINMLLRTFAWKNILDYDGPINKLIKMLGFEQIHFLGTDFAIILGMTYIYLPFMLLPIHTVLQKMDKAYVEASNDLGANPILTFFKIILPLSISGILSGVIMVLLPAATTLIIPKYLGEGTYNIGTLIDVQFYKDKRWSFGSALSILLAMIILFMVWCIKKFDRQKED